MPRDATVPSDPLVVVRRLSPAQRRKAMAHAARPVVSTTLACASQRRAELFSLFNSLSLVRRHGPTPFERNLRTVTEFNVRVRNKLAGVCLP